MSIREGESPDQRETLIKKKVSRVILISAREYNGGPYAHASPESCKKNSLMTAFFFL